MVGCQERKLRTNRAVIDFLPQKRWAAASLAAHRQARKLGLVDKHATLASRSNTSIKFLCGGPET